VQLILPTFLELVGKVEGLRVLDVGCADGYFTDLMVKLGAREAVGIDENAETIEIAKGLNTSEKCKYHATNFLDFNDDQPYDLVLCNFVLLYSHNETVLSNMIKKAYSLLGVGGRLVGTDDYPNHKIGTDL